MNAALNRMIAKWTMLMIVACFPSCIFANKVTTQIDGIDYTINTVSKCATMESCINIPSSGYLIIPERITYNGIIYPITAIESVLPSFSEDRILKRISIPGSVTSIGAWAFKGCMNLTELEFVSIESLCKIKIGLSNVNPFAFEHKLYIGDDEITYLYDFVNVKTINPYVFSYCTSITNASIGDTVEWIEYEAFRNCPALEQVTIGESVIAGIYYCFRDNKSLKKVIIKDADKEIAFGEKSFTNAPIEEIYMGRNLVYSYGLDGDGDWSAPLKKMETLKSVQIGPKVTEIGYSCFTGCINLTDVKFNNAIKVIKSKAFNKCSSISSLWLPNSISSIEEFAFKDNESLTFVKFPTSLEHLDSTAFNGCARIASVYLHNQTPPTSIFPFPDSPGATIYIPRGTLHSYVNAWGIDHDFMEMGDFSIKLNSELIKINIGEKISLIPEITYDGEVKLVTERWSSCNPEVATVENGIITAISIGETTIECMVEDEYGISKEAKCRIIVEPTMVESISIEGPSTTLKKGRQMQLIAIVAPTTDVSCSWDSSDNGVAIVDSNGLVTALSVGNVSITAMANDGSNVSASIVLNIIPPIKGDSNDDDRVTITDAVNIANYAMGYEVETFYPEAADVNEDNRITVSDASATVTIVLDQPEISAMTRARALAMVDEFETDELIIGDFKINVGEIITIPVFLADTREYVAMQGDIVVPAGMKIVDVNASKRSEFSHKTVTRGFDNGNVRFTIFDLKNSCFADNDAPVIEIVAIAESEVVGDIMVANIIASDSHAGEYVLTSAGGQNLSVSDVVKTSDSDRTVSSINSTIYISNAENEDVAIIAADGTVVAQFTAKSSHEQRILVPGVYMVVVGNMAKKVMVK